SRPLVLATPPTSSVPAAATPVRGSLPCPSRRPASAEIYTLSLHDALPILDGGLFVALTQSMNYEGKVNDGAWMATDMNIPEGTRSEEHTSELQSRFDLVCRLLLEKTKQPSTTPFMCSAPASLSVHCTTASH